MKLVDMYLLYRTGTVMAQISFGNISSELGILARLRPVVALIPYPRSHRSHHPPPPPPERSRYIFQRILSVPVLVPAGTVFF